MLFALRSSTPFLRPRRLLLATALLAGLLGGPVCLRAADPATDVAPLAIAKRLFGEGRYPDARAAFEKIRAMEPRNAEVVFYLGWTAFRLDQPEESVKLLEKATAMDATHSLYFHVLGDAYGVSAQRASLFSKLGLGKKCLAAYDRAVAVDPDNLEVRMARYQFYRNAPGFVGGGAEKAAAELEEIRRRDPTQAALLQVNQQLQEKQYDLAFATIDELLRLQPANKIALYQLGRIAAISGRQLDRGEVALKDYLRSTPTANEPPLFNASWRLGTLYEKKGDKAAARAAYQSSLELKPDFQRAKDALKKLQ